MLVSFFLVAPLPAMKKLLRPLGLVLVLSLLLLALLPNPSLAAPEWDVVVVDEHDQPIEGITVRETWQNFAVEKQLLIANRQTDANGRVTFPAQRARYSMLRQLAGTLRAAVSFNMHGGYDAYNHSWIFVIGNGVFGTANIDWKGAPPHVESRIVAKPVVVAPRTN
jgi:hypothetical protein